MLAHDADREELRDDAGRKGGFRPQPSVPRGLRQNRTIDKCGTDAMHAAAREAIAERDVEWLYSLVDHPELGPLFRKEEPLTEVDASRMNASLVAFMRIRETNFRQYKSGVLDKETWANYRSSIVRGPLSQPLARVWWYNFGEQLFDPELSEQISKDLRSAPVMPPFSSLFSTADPESNRKS